jgi:hypothetical protein
MRSRAWERIVRVRGGLSLSLITPSEVASPKFRELLKVFRVVADALRIVKVFAEHERAWAEALLVQVACVTACHNVIVAVVAARIRTDVVEREELTFKLVGVFGIRPGLLERVGDIAIDAVNNLLG